MPQIDPRIDAYIAGAAPFAQPILRHFRQLVHEVCPAVEETLKWRFPHFQHRGMLCAMAAFKAHCTIGFWKARLIFKNPAKPKAVASGESSLGQFGRLTSLADLPADAQLRRWIAEAVRLNETGVKPPARPKARVQKPLIVPPFLTAALKRNAAARAAFGQFSYSHKKEYVEWLTDAKTDATRQKRLATALLWMAKGKSRNWKYQ